MMIRTRIFIAFLALVCCSTVQAKLLPIGIQEPASLSHMLKKTMPAVVNIRTEGELPIPNDPFLRKQIANSPSSPLLEDPHFTSIGSGVIIDADKGLIVTNAHVIDLAKNIMVTLNDGRHYQAKKIGADNASDIAVIQIRAQNLTAIPFANSDRVEVGDFIAAIGNPFGLSQSVTSGIVSAIHRGDLGLEGLENFIQIDAPINVGNSGGALVNLDGELIGINTALLSRTGDNIGIGFAIPSNMARNVVEQIIKFGKVHHGLMGVLVQTLTPDLAQAFHASNHSGAVITEIVPYSPAAEAGLRTGDIITNINGKKINTNLDVQNIAGLLRIGSKVSITVLRDGQTKTVDVATADPKNAQRSQEEKNPYLFGVQMKEIAEQSPSYGTVIGIRIIKVQSYSAASIAGLQPGDTIISANRQPVHSIAELLKIASTTKEGLLLHIIRDGGSAFAIIK